MRGHGYVCAYADDVRGGKDSLRVSPQYLPLQYVLDFLACGEFDQLRFPTGFLFSFSFAGSVAVHPPAPFASDDGCAPSASTVC